MHEFQELREELGIRQRVARYIAEHTDVALLLGEAAYDLHAAKKQKIVDDRHESGRRGDLDILRRHDDRAVFGAQARQGLIEAQLALRQADDRLEIKINAVLLQR